jgi:ABC-type lipopolysaccharide export system ATPase subunit
MLRWRRLVRNYETRIDVSKAMIHIALGSLLLRRILMEGQPMAVMASREVREVYLGIGGE